IRVLINIVNRVEQLAGVDQRVYWCKLTLFKLADELFISEANALTINSETNASIISNIPVITEAIVPDDTPQNMIWT
ncbi:20946_t:CDS:1, partial [Rhizophagus irregularis]